jgi:competence protein ComEA
MDNLAYLRWRLGGIVALAAIAGLIYLVSRQGQYVPSPQDVDAARRQAGVSTTAPAVSTTTTPDLVVHVMGAVRHPGVYSLPAGVRVGDAITAAGGLGEGADVERLNLAERVADGQRIYVLRTGQSAPATLAQSAPAGTSSSNSTGPVNLNTASASELDALPGVGPATAQAIISYRNEHGPFSAVEQLASVKGIGPAKLAQLVQLVQV